MAGTSPAMTAGARGRGRRTPTTANAMRPATIYCRKSEIALSCAYEKSRPFACKDRPLRFRAADVGAQTALKNLSAKIQRNPLISLDSDERIQGNPRKSNPRK